VFRRVLAAECFKVSHRLPLLFWGFLFVPVISFVVDILLITNPMRLPGITPHVDLLARLLRSMEISGSPMAQVFFIAAAAVIFGAEYDSGTWRLTAPRGPRSDWILAKAMLYAGGVLCSLALIALGTTLCAVLESRVQLMPLTWVANERSPSVAFALILVISWFELILIGLISGLVAVTSRSVLIPTIGLTLLAFCQSILISVVRVPSLIGKGLASVAIVTVPGIAADVGRLFAAHAEVSPGVYVTEREAGVGVASLCAWIICTLLFALMWFRRQELSRE
jgi:hypothetical protein